MKSSFLRSGLLALVLVGAVGLAGCDLTTGSGGAPGGSAAAEAKTTQVITEAQQKAVSICSYLPTAQTITDIFLSGNPIYQTATGIASAICKAVSNKSAARRSAAPPTVAGVVIRGRRV